MSFMEKFADPEIIHTLTFGEKMTGALITTCMGMGITFAVLILLWGCISLMTRLTARAGKTKQEATAPPPVAKAEGTVVEDKREIAVVMAAIAAYEGGTLDNLVIRKISRVSGNATAWGNAGRTDCIESRKL